MTKCKLCLKEKNLCESHIIPEYFYKPMYDSKNRFFKLSIIENEKNKFMQKGLKEHLLCNECEQQINNYEKYINGLMYYDQPSEVYQDNKIAIVKNINYRKMKLFQLSILWRASISTLKSFNEVKLGPHQEKIRMMILNQNPGGYLDYGCMIMAVFIDTKKLADGLLVSPDVIKYDSYRIFRFIFGGMMWLYFVSSHNERFRFSNFFLQEDGTLTIHKKAFEDINYIFDMEKDLYKQGKL